MVYDEHSSFGVVKNVGKKTGCQCFTANVMQTSFQQVFQSDNHVYCDLNNSTLEVFI